MVVKLIEEAKYGKSFIRELLDELEKKEAETIVVVLSQSKKAPLSIIRERFRK